MAPVSSRRDRPEPPKRARCPYLVMDFVGVLEASTNKQDGQMRVSVRYVVRLLTCYYDRLHSRVCVRKVHELIPNYNKYVVLLEDFGSLTSLVSNEQTRYTTLPHSRLSIPTYRAVTGEI